MRKIAGNNPKVDLVSMNAYTKSGESTFIGSQDIEWKRISDINQGQFNSVTNLQKKMPGNNPKVDRVRMNAYTKFDEILSIGS